MGGGFLEVERGGGGRGTYAGWKDWLCGRLRGLSVRFVMVVDTSVYWPRVSAVH